MNHPDPTTAPESPSVESGAGTQAAARRRGRLLVVLLGAVALLAVAMGAAWWQAHRLLARVDAAETSAGEVSALGTRLARLETGQRQLLAQAAKLEDELSHARSALDTLYRDRRTSNLDWTLAELEYLLVIAEQRLVLARDARTALAAMEAAALRLQGLNDPRVEPVRAQLQEDMASLRGVPEVDLSALAVYLADLAGRVGDLSLAGGERAGGEPAREGRAADTDGWRGALRSAWEEIRGLVVITRGPTAFAMPEERYYLVQNLRLQLETARLAVQQRDTEVFRASLRSAAEWLQRYFDPGAGEVAAALQSLQRMMEVELDPALPDITSSLESVRALARMLAGMELAAPDKDTDTETDPEAAAEP